MLKPGMSYSQLKTLEKNAPVPDPQEVVGSEPRLDEQTKAKVDAMRQKLMDLRDRRKG